MNKEFEEVKKEFKDVKDKYNTLRNNERQKIVNAFKKHNFEARRNQATSRYTSRKQISPSFNLKNWKWVEAYRDGYTVLIGLQAIERDSKTKNIHVLFDRISIDVFYDPDRKILSEECDSYFQSINKRFNNMEIQYINNRFGNTENLFNSIFFNSIITEFEIPMESDHINNLIKFVEDKIKEIQNSQI
ncbi:hypothetical protein [Parvimonas sp. G1967]|uniref:hypothetical protein n=1 Tax=Parvimonas sp. G1967 TaxID=3387695 RepID=UPI0039E40BAC